MVVVVVVVVIIIIMISLLDENHVILVSISEFKHYLSMLDITGTAPDDTSTQPDVYI